MSRRDRPGTGVTVLPGLYQNSTDYPGVLTASSVSGRFARISSSSVFFREVPTCHPTSVDLTLNRIPFNAVPGESADAGGVGNILESAYSTRLTGQQAAFFSNVIVSPTTNILTELSGESNTGAERAAFQLTNQFLTLMLDPFVNVRGYAPGWPSAGGPAFGFAPAEHALPPDVALAGGRSDAFQAGVCGINWFGPAYLAGALAFSNHWFTTSRSVLGDQLTADFNGQSFGARIEGGYRYAVLPTLGVTPYGAVQFQDFHKPAYSESQGDLTSGGFGLSFNGMNATDTRTELGSRFDAPTFVYGNGDDSLRPIGDVSVGSIP